MAVACLALPREEPDDQLDIVAVRRPVVHAYGAGHAPASPEHRARRTSAGVDGPTVSGHGLYHEPAPEISLSGSPAPGIGGLSIVTLAAVITVIGPEGWWLLAGANTAGLLLGAAMVWYRHGNGRRTDLNRYTCLHLGTR